MHLQDQGYGVEKGIPTTLIAATSFDNIVGITLFGIFADIAYNSVGTKTKSPAQTVGINTYQIATGVAMGFVIGAVVGVALKKCKNWMLLKLFVILLFLG